MAGIPKQRYIIGIFILLMLSVIVILDLSFLSDKEEAHIEESSSSTVDPLPSEAGVFERAHLTNEYKNMPNDPAHKNSLKDNYERRAYYGAPPVIPHIILNENSFGGKACLQCHQDGGFVAQFNAFTPVTPHPELINCRQCHVPVKTKSLFVGSAFTGLSHPATGNAALPGSPPVMPHALQMHENCLACHGGPGAPAEIRVTHPERVNCRQCHVPASTKNIEWVRATYDTLK